MISVKGTYSINIVGEDWGCAINKVFITLDKVLDHVTQKTFKVTETKQVIDWNKSTYPVVETTVNREVIDAYMCDKHGEKTDSCSCYIILELHISPDEGSPLLFSMNTQLNTWSQPYYLTITLNDEVNLTSNGLKVTSLMIDQIMNSKTTSADKFNISSYCSTEGIKYNYAYFMPKEKSDTLVVWLHGLGEGGTKNTDPYVTTLANKVTALIQDEFQTKLNGANILVPQCPTYWMDKDGKKTNFNKGAIIADGTSFYTNSLIELIDNYKEKCQAQKVIIAGCSNGGYMTMILAIKNPDKYTAIVPICEALPDNKITDEQIASLKDLPMYFIYSLDDKIVDPTLHEIPTIKRLKHIKATHLHVSTTEHVIDTSGKYKDIKGNPYTYNGHWSWIYFDNNETKCNDCGISAFDFIAEIIDSK